MTNAYKYLIKVGSLEEERAYSYSGKIGQCAFDSSKIAVKVKKGRRENLCKIRTNSHKLAHNEPHRGVCGSLCEFENVLFSKENKMHKSHTFAKYE